MKQNLQSAVYSKMPGTQQTEVSDFKFHVDTAFSFLNYSRKQQLLNMVNMADELPIYYVRGVICETCIVKKCYGIPRSEVCVKNTEKWLESEAPSDGIDWGGQE